MTIKKENSKNLSSSERARRHGEVRMLKAIKRKQKYQEPRKHKILKRHDYADEKDFENTGEDIRDVDFRLNNDSSKVEILLRSSKADKHLDVLLLKLIIVSGFYPQIAIADDFNYCKGGSQQFFHTFLKPFISLHPNSYFAKDFDSLRLNDSDILEKPSYYTLKPLLSSRHQILCYQNLLETAKPYLMNCIRLPAAQALLMFSYSIDTNLSITRIVCDSWLCLDFPSPEAGSKLLTRSIQLRRLWNKLLSQKLTDLESNTMNQNKTSSEEEQLWQSLTDFMSINIEYTIKRLLPADLKTLYTRNRLPMDMDDAMINPFAEDFKIDQNMEKGGINVTENVVYGCIQEIQWTIDLDNILSEHTWICKYCQTKIDLRGIKKLIHIQNCKNRSQIKTNEELKTNKNVTSRSVKGIKYNCENCKKEMYLTQIDILRHKKNCI